MENIEDIFYNTSFKRIKATLLSIIAFTSSHVNCQQCWSKTICT